MRTPVEDTDGWQTMETAPKDGTEFLGRGRNWGDEKGGWHRHVTKWLEDRWVDADDEDLTLTHLVGWKSTQ